MISLQVTNVQNLLAMMVAPIARKHYLWVQIPPGCPPFMGLFFAIIYARMGHNLWCVVGINKFISKFTPYC